MQSYAALAFLVLATAFSWPSAMTIFVSKDDAVIPVPTTTMIASAVSISCLGLAFSVAGPLVGCLTVASAVLLGTVIRTPSAGLSAALSVAFLSFYLQSRYGGEPALFTIHG